MTDDDPRIAAFFDQLIPRARQTRDWQLLLADASAPPPARRAGAARPFPRLQGRLLVIAVAVVVAVAVPLTALGVGLATGRGFWFLSAYSPKPASRVVTVISGTWGGTTWSLTAFRATTGNVCYAVTVNPPVLQEGASEACGPITPTARIGFLRSTEQVPRRPAPTFSKKLLADLAKQGFPPPHVTKPFPPYIVGAVVGPASEVDIAGPHTPLQRVATIAAPGWRMGSDVRFFIARRPLSRDVSGLTARDATGATVATMAVESPYRPKVYRLSNPGRKLRLSHTIVHELRLAHHSTDVYLLAARDGLTFYRLGKTGRCFGTGRVSTSSRATPRNPLHLSDIGCSGHRFSPTHPMVDNSIWGQDSGDPVMHLYQFSGIASNEVVAIDLVNADGTLIERVPVRDSVYTAKPIPPRDRRHQPDQPGGVWVLPCGFGKGSYETRRC